MPHTLLIALSGPSSSGKTTLARLLRDILPHQSPRTRPLILHLDDFYVSDQLIPLVSVGDSEKVQDWDCLEALDLNLLYDVLKYTKEHGEPPSSHKSKEDQNAIGEVGISEAGIQAWTNRLREDEECKSLLGLSSSETQPTRIIIIDGFLLYHASMSQISTLFDTKLFLPTTHTLMKTRREARQGYVTIEGFWEDPPGYVDQIVWPNYARDHGRLFMNGDVEGELDEEMCQRERIKGMPWEFKGDINGALGWVVQTVKEELQIVRGKS